MLLLHCDAAGERFVVVGVRAGGEAFAGELALRRATLFLSRHPLERRTTPRAILVDVPMDGAVQYRLLAATTDTYATRMLVRLPRVSLVNLVLDRDAVPELIQSEAEPERIAREVEALLASPERIAAMRRDLAELRGRLGEPGASGRAADQVAAFLGQGVPA